MRVCVSLICVSCVWALRPGPGPQRMKQYYKHIHIWSTMQIMQRVKNIWTDLEGHTHNSFAFRTCVIRPPYFTVYIFICVHTFGSALVQPFSVGLPLTRTVMATPEHQQHLKDEPQAPLNLGQIAEGQQNQNIVVLEFVKRMCPVNKMMHIKDIAHFYREMVQNREADLMELFLDLNPSTPDPPQTKTAIWV